MRRVRSQFPQSALRRLFAVRGREVTDGAAGARSFRGTHASASDAIRPSRKALLAVGAVGAALGVAPGASAQDCPNSAIRAEQGPAVEALPGCMALEMASPPKKFSQAAESASVSVDGSRVRFWSRGGLEDPPGMVDVFSGDSYVATRGPGGWSVSSALLPSQPTGDLVWGWSAGSDIPRSFSPDFSRWVGLAASVEQQYLGQARVFRAGVGGVFSPLSPLLVPLDPADRVRLTVQGAFFQGASADHSRVYFKPGFSDTDTEGTTYRTTTYLEGDPAPAGGEAHVYVAGLGVGGVPSVELLARDSDGRVWGERCGAHVGGQPGGPAPGAGLNGRDQGAVSRDGSRVLFSTRPGQTGVGVCDPVANRLRVMRRVETAAGPWVTVLSGSECDRVAPVCDAVDGDDLYEGASVDGSRVYFTSNRQLADSDLDGAGSATCSTFAVAGCDLYMWDATRPGGERLVQVSAGEANAAHPTVGSGAGVAKGTVAISGDGSHVYFVAEGVLTDAPNPSGNVAVAGQRNMFVWDADQEALAFVGTLSGSDGALWGDSGTFKNNAYPVPGVGTDANGVEVGGAGHILAFRTTASLTGDDSDGGGADVYRYDADAGELQRISAAAAGGSDNGAFDVRPRALYDGSRVGTDFAEYKRWVSEDGETIVFQTDEGLVAGDDDGLFNDYLWREGELYRLPGTSRDQLSLGTTGKSLLAPALSHDGSSVAFEAITQLLPQDGDVVSDVYVARVGGGFAQPDTPAPCAVLADGCQGGGPGAIPADAETSSAAGSENASAQERKTLAIAGLSKRARKRAARRGVLAVRVSSNSPGRVKLTARARLGRKVARVAGRTVRIRKAGAVTVRLRLNRSARERLASGRRLGVTVRVSRSGARSRAMSVLLPGVKS
ncbi:MAG TPA: hypothetical protein VEW67_03230 [Thermoleophilaceae bacterium]|nr:hypothetical protein [Thermoleophilaceae bacterium]